MANLNACPHSEVLQQLEGEQLEGDIDAVLDHLERCEQCQAVYGTFVEKHDPWLEQFAGVAVEDLDRVREELAIDTAAIEETASVPPRFQEVRNAPSVLRPPCNLKHYKVLRRVGGGGMGEVYEGWDTLIERRVAIKVQCQMANAEGVDRFRAELAVNGQLDHPNIVKTYAGEQHEGTLFLIQEYLEGATLQTLARKNQLGSAESLIDVLVGVCHGLQALHAKGLVHRDIKPGNVMRLVNGTVKLIDYGLALPVDVEATPRLAGAGTPGFMAPEQLQGQTSIDHRSDIYSLGRLIQYLLNNLAVDRNNVRQQKLVTGIESLAGRMCQRDVASRPGNLGAIVAELRRLPERSASPRQSGCQPSAKVILSAKPTADRSEATNDQGCRRWRKRTLLAALAAPLAFAVFQFVFETDRPAKVIVENHQPGDIIEITSDDGTVREVHVGPDAVFSVDAGTYTLSLKSNDGRRLRPSQLEVTGKETLTVRIHAMDTTRPLAGVPAFRPKPHPSLSADVVAEFTLPRRVVLSPDGSKAVVSSGGGRLSVVDVASSEQVAVLGEIDQIEPGGLADAVWSQDGKYVYGISHTQTGGLHVIDVGDPSSPTEVAFLRTPNYAHEIHVSGDGCFVFIADGHAGLIAVDVRAPLEPEILSICKVRAYTQGVDLSTNGQLAFLSCWKSGLRIVDISDPASMSFLGGVPLAGDSWKSAVSNSDELVYAGCRGGTIYVIDVSNPAAPEVISQIDGIGRIERLVMSKDRRWLFVIRRSQAIWVFDLSTPRDPVRLGLITASGGVGDLSVFPSGREALIAVLGKGLAVAALKDVGIENDAAGRDSGESIE